MLNKTPTPKSLIDNADYNSMLEHSLVTILDEVPEPPICMEIVQKDSDSIIGTLGNFSLVIGKAKQGKTFVISMALAAAESGMPFNELLKVTLPLSKRKIILFDTEQSKYHVQKVLRRICKMAGKNIPVNLIVYSLRSRTPAERLKLIEIALLKHDDVSLVVIDGIRDLVTSINDEEQSTNIASHLLRWTEELNIHIVTVLHMNKSDANARGHLGTELTNKSETVISVTKSSDEKNIVTVKAEYCRDQDFEPWAFRINENGVPSIMKNWIDTISTPKRKTDAFSPTQIPRETHVEIIKSVLRDNPNQKRSEFKENLSAELFKRYGQEISSKLNSVFDYYLAGKIIYKDGSPPQTKYRLVNELPLTTTE